MIGLVLWSDSEEKKAVFWCEDHGDLAYYDGAEEQLCEEATLAAGDMVDFEVSVDQSIRRAHSARLLRSKVCRSIQDSLLTAAKGNAVRGNSVPAGSGGAAVLSDPAQSVISLASRRTRLG